MIPFLDLDNKKKQDYGTREALNEVINNQYRGVVMTD